MRLRVERGEGVCVSAKCSPRSTPYFSLVARVASPLPGREDARRRSTPRRPGRGRLRRPRRRHAKAVDVVVRWLLVAGRVTHYHSRRSGTRRRPGWCPGGRLKGSIRTLLLLLVYRVSDLLCFIGSMRARLSLKQHAKRALLEVKIG